MPDSPTVSSICHVEYTDDNDECKSEDCVCESDDAYTLSMCDRLRIGVEITMETWREQVCIVFLCVWLF